MPRYFFDIADGDDFTDHQGSEWPDLAAARVEAVRYAAEVLKEMPERFWNTEEWVMTVRDALRRPILFVQGTRDTLCPLDLLAGVRAEMEAPNILHVVEGGDHSLGVGKRQLRADGEAQEEVDRRILESIARFVHLPS